MFHVLHSLTWMELFQSKSSNLILNYDSMKGLCQECFTSNAKIMFNKVAEKDGLVTQICTCEKCKNAA
ncbi:hypothetical protein K0U27_08690 [archaeon]|nr:hypothetical protein [archaeon]